MVKFLATQVDPREELASGHYDINFEVVKISSEAVGIEPSECNKNTLQQAEERINSFLKVEDVKCVMLQDYLKALAVHTEY